MQTTEVTQEQWFKAMGNNPSRFNTERDCPSEFRRANGIGLCPNNPVEQVSWDEIQLFIQKMDDQSDGYHYRLPTEAEWEYAARGGNTSPYPFSYNIAEIGWLNANAGSKSHPVAQLRPNAYGLYDVCGNVWEWVSDWYADYPIFDVTDPSGPNSGLRRIIRGGGWGGVPQDCYPDMRFGSKPDAHSPSVGFRLVKLQDEK